jgi:hypothetical protein
MYHLWYIVEMGYEQRITPGSTREILSLRNGQRAGEGVVART